MAQEKATPTKATKEQQLGFSYALLAVLFFGSSAVLVLYADPVPPLEKAFWRLAVATSFVGLLLSFGRERISLSRASLPRFALYGLITAVHFAFYILSLSYTTAAHCLTIVYTSPAFVALFSAFFLKERLTARRWLGIGIAALGVGILAGFEPQLTPAMLLGDALALVSAIAYGLYSIAGRRERDNYSLFSYTFGVYSFAALWMLPLAAFSFLSGNGPTNYAIGPLFALLALGVIPLGLGHTLYNAGLRRLNATYVNIIATQEVTLGILFTWLLNGQEPSLAAIVGALVTLGGVLVVLL